MAKLAKFLYSTALVVITAWLCSYFTRSGIANWYESFEKPAVTPPNEIFAPVWALIYGLMIVSFYQILTRRVISAANRRTIVCRPASAADYLDVSLFLRRHARRGFRRYRFSGGGCLADD